MKSLIYDVKKCQLPSTSELWSRVSSKDFLDCYCVEADSTPRRASEVITTFPAWADFLLAIRRIVTAPFGLSNDGPDHSDKVGAFPVELENDQELIAGFDDKHLEFRVAVLSLEGKVYLATWVHPHNIAGRMYLATIMPFHILIARDALARVRLDRSPNIKEAT